MRRFNLLLMAFVSLSLLLGAASLVAQQKKVRPTVAVADFEVKARGVGKDVGAGMSEILTNAIFELGKYRVVDRSSMNKILEEQQRVLHGEVDATTGAQVGKLIGANYLVIGVLTKLSEKQKAGGIGGIVSRRVGMGLVTFESEVGLSLKIVDSSTGELLASKVVNTKKKSTGLAVGGRFGGIPLGGFTFKSKSMEDALEEAIGEAVDHIDEQVPDEIFIAEGEDTPADEPDCSNFIGAAAPKIMVVIPEIHIRQPIPDPAGETEIIRCFVEADFNLVDQQQIAAIRNQEKVINATKDASLAAALGVEFGADIIIIGEAFSELAGRRGERVSCRARVEARAIETRTGRILAANGMHGSAWDVAESVAAKTALRNAGSQMADYFMAQLCRKMGSTETNQVMSLEIFVGSTNYTQLTALSKMVESLPKVQKVTKKLTGAAGRLFVEYSGSAEELADGMSSAKLVDLGFEITGLSPSKLDVSVKKVNEEN